MYPATTSHLFLILDSVSECAPLGRGATGTRAGRNTSALESGFDSGYILADSAIGERGFRKLRLYTAELQWVAKTAPTRRAKKNFIGAQRSYFLIRSNKMEAGSVGPHANGIPAVFRASIMS